ncbi:MULTISPECIES: hypothetical protein [Streptomyces]|uniref:Uncharacterized protein n=1 Tax=Streptomyces rimosus subsp. rimosus (strain ATCC 10970 / DSM 40260 / JCM 4667 / NRRL 2234) TaxID=1265868 RepID=L8ELD6_STRR1|nr:MULTISPECIES: hypothetical protein [Streptomyces]KOG84132.1 hypothetical protein ADK78_00575 [Kitasatospora aureofaciens]MYT41186.1 hypothetical protein [Streptomyces sp. SID5471]KOT27972.1 hypothetical protein ADK84_37520 [Streptomyces sp. NRRL WC-3701]KOT42271.1 hypothetical protein ADK42_10285 [Streptomyces rimosus subsp. rimosus]KOT68569.1 hypothetical protein ADK44_00950 [Streptomyces rimosus subsp. rimosus]
MPSLCAPAPAAPRSVAEVNEEIRAYMQARSGRPLWPEEQMQYEQLLREWAAAVRGDIATTA